MLMGTTNDDSTETTVTIKSLAGHNGTGTKEYKVPKKKIYSARPHIVADNHFSGEQVMDYIGKNGFGITTTCRRDRFPPGLKDFLHHDKVQNNRKIKKFVVSKMTRTMKLY